MGRLADLNDKKVYLDANILIYLFEGEPSFEKTLNHLFDMVEFEMVQLVTSDLSITEFFHGVIKSKGIIEAEKLLPDFVNSDYFKVFSIEQKAYFIAADIRIQNKLKTPDALHVAAALANKCDIFLTNDRGIKSVAGLEVIYLSDFQ